MSLSTVSKWICISSLGIKLCNSLVDECIGKETYIILEEYTKCLFQINAKSSCLFWTIRALENITVMLFFCCSLFAICKLLFLLYLGVAELDVFKNVNSINDSVVADWVSNGIGVNTFLLLPTLYRTRRKET